MPVWKPSRRGAAHPGPTASAGFALSLAVSLILGLAPIIVQAQPVAGATVAWHCYRNAVATVLATDKTNAVGTKFLVRPATADLKADCAVEPRPSDRVLGDDSAADRTARVYIDLVKTFLIVDDGTGPDRTLVIHEVPAARRLLSVGHSVQEACDPTSGCRSEEFGIDDTGLTFWRRIADKSTPKNCPGYPGFMKTTGAAALEERSVFTFATRTGTSGGKRRCTARQGTGNHRLSRGDADGRLGCSGARLAPVDWIRTRPRSQICLAQIRISFPALRTRRAPAAQEPHRRDRSSSRRSAG